MIENAQDEALIILAEECSEVIKIISKIHRYGLDTIAPWWPGQDPETNQHKLACELGDLQAMIDIVSDVFCIEKTAIIYNAAAKKSKLKNYSEHLKNY